VNLVSLQALRRQREQRLQVAASRSDHQILLVEDGYAARHAFGRAEVAGHIHRYELPALRNPDDSFPAPPSHAFICGREHCRIIQRGRRVPQFVNTRLRPV